MLMTVLNNPCLLQTIIICSAVVIVIMIVPFIIMVCKHDSDKRTLFGLYVFLTSIVLLIGISMFSFHFKECSKVLEFISLLSAIVSIILAVLTIVYSYYTSSANMKNLGKIEDSADTIMKTSEHICKISEQVVQLEGMIEDLKPYIGQEMQKLGDAFNNKTEYDNSDILNSIDNRSDDKKTPFNYDSFLETFSIIGILFLHICVKCESAKPRISFQEIARIFEHAAVQYLLGVLVTLNSLFGDNCVDVDYEQTCIIINNLDNDFKEAIEKRMRELMSTNKVIKVYIKNISRVLTVNMEIDKIEVNNE